jgi:uncharacterized protein (TIGR02145 family)
MTAGAGNASHTATVSGLTDGSTNNIFVKCTYPNSPLGVASSVTFTVANPPPPTTMQEMTLANCPTAAPLVVRDTRDNTWYAVQKLADGKCWMLTNLAYGGAEAGTQLTSGAGQTTTTGVAASATNWNQANPPFNNQRQWVDPTTSTVTHSASGTRCAVAGRTNPSVAPNMTYTECGYLYNWCAALGNASASCNASTAGQNIANAGVGTCPAGWRLPTGGPSGEFQAMHTATGGTYASLIGPSSAWRGVLAGGFSPPNGGFFGGGLAGYQWTATTRGSSGEVYGVSFGANPTPIFNLAVSYGGKWHGLSVRCILG